MTVSTPFATKTATGVRLSVRVIPRASRTAVGGVRDGRLVVRVTAPPVDSAANDAVIGALSAALGIPRRALAIAAGATSRNKTIDIAGADLDGVRSCVETSSGQR